tara:strand:- start:176 stop:352 length:177 start_codon:yes stop_codon:yes gene_type:complete
LIWVGTPSGKSAALSIGCFAEPKGTRKRTFRDCPVIIDNADLPAFTTAMNASPSRFKS